MSAYQDGYRAGHLDRLMSYKSVYASNCGDGIHGSYSMEYSRGYHDGWWEGCSFASL